MPIKDHRILEETLSNGCANANILFSYNAETYDGATLFAHKKIKEYVKLGLMAPVPFDIQPAYKRKQCLYYVTEKGAKLIGRQNEFKQKTTKAYHDIAHELMKYDVNLALRRNYPDFDFKTEYEKRFRTGIINKATGKEQHIEVDIFVTATKKDELKTFYLLIETEHKTIRRTFSEKVLFYDKLMANDFFRLNGLPDKTKILFVCCNREFPTFTRPQEFWKPDIKKGLSSLYTQFGVLMESVKEHFTTDHDKYGKPIISTKHFLYLPFPEVFNIREKGCLTNDNTRVNLFK